MKIKKCRDRVRKMEKSYYRMMKYLKRKGELEFSDSHVFSYWTVNDEKEPYRYGYYRFRAVPILYEAACKFFPLELAPFVTETLYTFDSTCYHNEYENLIGMLTVDYTVSPCFNANIPEKLAIMSAAFSWRGDIQNLWINDYRRQFDHIELAQAARSIREDGWERYYEQITLPFIRTIAVNGAWDQELYGDISYEANPEGKCDWEGIAQKLHVDESLNKTAVKFLIEDVYDYIWGCDCFQYNPYWIYGSDLYGELMKRDAALPWREWFEQSKNSKVE